MIFLNSEFLQIKIRSLEYAIACLILWLLASIISSAFKKRPRHFETVDERKEIDNTENNNGRNDADSEAAKLFIYDPGPASNAKINVLKSEDGFMVVPPKEEPKYLLQDFKIVEKETDGEKEQVAAPVKTTLNDPYEPTLDLRDYKYPSLDLLETHGSELVIHNAEELEIYKNQIINTLKNYNIAIQKIFATVGPAVILFEIVPAAGVRISKIKNLEDEIALSLLASGIRIIAPIPGKGTIGIEVPNIILHSG